MRHPVHTRAILAAAVSALSVALACGARAEQEWISEFDVSHEPGPDGKIEYTVRLLPGHTHECERLSFECVYRQEFPWVDFRGRKYKKIHEPVTFTYGENDVRLVNDLDKYVNFRVPVAMERLKRMYGPTAFNEEYPVTVARIVVSARNGGKTLWSYEIPADGKCSPADPAGDKSRAEPDDSDLDALE